MNSVIQQTVLSFFNLNSVLSVRNTAVNEIEVATLPSEFSILRASKGSEFVLSRVQFDFQKL